MLVLRGSPGARGLTIDTAAEPGDNPVIDEWGKSDVRFLSDFFWQPISVSLITGCVLYSQVIRI